ncbi:hypothetical protein GCM10009792_02680 [Microcella alkalica]|uniref:RimJ/RimL family protein N-acetyltransferase/precorrin-6B methylase 2 n=1 Tax=Microcella alkalica TaxID=355930 RepID=A0A839E5R7_9MICO|nr:GNAT family N-acetyltransferase [Microcella alkalica]MBA8848009.1 RimJ/RimL family protein N-acetyltransferase/precorrin-6B methylase 2 [Microcella alkalica]
MTRTAPYRPLDTELTTERLALTPFHSDDAVAYAAICAARGGEPADPATILERIPALEHGLAQHGLGLRMLRLAGERWPVGYIALIPGRATVDEPELVSELLPAVRGHGLATEAAYELIAAAWRTGRERLWTTIAASNLASLRVAAKVGFIAQHVTNDERGEVVWSDPYSSGVTPAPPHDSDALTAALEIVECPLCREALERVDGGVRCEAGHHFDVARQGYASLRGGASTATGDTVAMVEARERVQASGAHDAIAAAIAEAVPVDARWLVDLGGGTGWHAARVLDARPSLRGIVLDASVPALRRAARAHERLAAVASDVWRGVPVQDASVDVVLRVFAPGGGERGAAELERILAPRARVVIAVPEADHHRELVESLRLLRVPAGKAEEAEASIPGARLVSSTRVRAVHELGRDQVLDLVMMGPNAFHQQREALSDLLVARDEPIAVTIAVSVVVLEIA